VHKSFPKNLLGIASFNSEKRQGSIAGLAVSDLGTIWKHCSQWFYSLTFKDDIIRQGVVSV